MKIIFLDINGVLNFTNTEARAPSGSLGIVGAKVRLIKHIVDKTGAKIVLTSPWRKNWRSEDGGIAASGDGAYMVGKFDRYGLHVLDKIEDEYEPADREEGIHAWLKDRPYVEDYVIIDADDTIYKDLSHCVFTHDDTGLTESEEDIAVKILEREI